MSFRIGQGIDTHQLVDGYTLIIGGVTIPFEKIYSDTESSYMDIKKDKLIYYVVKELDEKIHINFFKNYENITKINLKMKFSRLNLNNQNNCSND